MHYEVIHSFNRCQISLSNPLERGQKSEVVVTCQRWILLNYLIAETIVITHIRDVFSH